MDALKHAEESMDAKIVGEDDENTVKEKDDELLDEAATRKAIEEGARLPPN